jgi:hypothetical protein
MENGLKFRFEVLQDKVLVGSPNSVEFKDRCAELTESLETSHPGAKVQMVYVLSAIPTLVYASDEKVK